MRDALSEQLGFQQRVRSGNVVSMWQIPGVAGVPVLQR